MQDTQKDGSDGSDGSRYGRVSLRRSVLNQAREALLDWTSLLTCLLFVIVPWRAAAFFRDAKAVGLISPGRALVSASAVRGHSDISTSQRLGRIGGGEEKRKMTVTDPLRLDSGVALFRFLTHLHLRLLVKDCKVAYNRLFQLPLRTGWLTCLWISESPHLSQ